MKYLHSGYILFCERANHTENGQVDVHGLFDLFVGSHLPIQVNCHLVVGFGTEYERRQYKGEVILENPDGKQVFQKEFQANDPSGSNRGHCILKLDGNLDKEGLWTIKVNLKNWKDEDMWDLQRQFWATLSGDKLTKS